MQSPPLIGLRQIVVVIVCLAAMFAVSALYYLDSRQKEDVRVLAGHARIIANDVWAINPAGVENYLRLAMETEHYRNIRVTIPGDERFLVLVNADLGGIDALLQRLGLIWTRAMTAAISHGELQIGEMRVVQYVRVVIPLVQLFGLYLLLFILALFMLFLFARRRTLEMLVAERTASLQESQRRFHDLVNLLPEMVLEIDLDGVITYANTEARSRFGLSEEEHCGTSLFDCFPENEREGYRQLFHQSLDEGTLFQGMIEDCHRHAFPVLLRGAPILQGEQMIGARLLLIDITERQRMEQQLSRDRKMKAIGLMAGGVAHDLNNILSGVVSYPELLLLDMAADNPLRRPLTLIHKAGLEASQIVADLLTVARGSRGYSELVDPNALIGEYLDSPDFEEMRCRHPLVDYSFLPAADLLPISCSAIHVRKCLMNLVINGFEAIAGQGEVRIATGNVSSEEIAARDLGLPGDRHYIRITVSDTGRGIEEKEIEHIFEPFYSKKVMGRSGTGLGLTVVWNTVRDHGGVTKVTSSQQGSTFELIFPATVNEQVRKTGEQQVLRGNGEAILVIDDEERQREIASTLLRTLGYRVEAAGTAQEAWSYLVNRPVDLVVLDMIMGPGEPSGREIYQRILSRHPGQRAIIASGYAEDDDVRKTLAMGAGAFVPKPYTIAAMSLAVHQGLRSRQSAIDEERQGVAA